MMEEDNSRMEGNTKVVDNNYYYCNKGVMADSIHKRLEIVIITDYEVTDYYMENDSNCMIVFVENDFQELESGCYYE